MIIIVSLILIYLKTIIRVLWIKMIMDLIWK